MWKLKSDERVLSFKTKALALQNTFRKDGKRIRKIDFDSFKAGDTVYKQWTVYHSCNENFVVGDGTTTSKDYTRKVGLTMLKPFILCEEA